MDPLASPAPSVRGVIVYIARCPEHGLHGERTECYVCAGPVERVPHLAWDHAHAAMLRFRERILQADEPAALVLDEDAFMEAWTDCLAATTPDLGDLAATPDAVLAAFIDAKRGRP